MKWLLFLPLLALPLLFVSCDRETPTEPADGSSQALFEEVSPQAAPETSPLYAYCTGAACSEVGGDFYSGSQDMNLWYNVCPATKGTITVHLCQAKKGPLTFASRCENRENVPAGWVAYGKLKVADRGCDASFVGLSATASVRGWRVKYTAQGSGYKNSTIVFDSYPGSP